MEQPTNKNTLQDKDILDLLDTAPKEGFRLLFDTYYMRLCLYAVQLTDSFELAEDTVQDFSPTYGRRNTIKASGKTYANTCISR